MESASEKEEREREIYTDINFDKNLAATRRERENKREIRRELVCNIFHGWMETTMVSLWRMRPFPRTRQMKFHSGKHHPGQRHICEKDDARAKPMRSPPIPSPLAPLAFRGKFIHPSSEHSFKKTNVSFLSLSLSLLFLLFPWARVFVWAKSFLRNVERREVSNFEIATFPSVLFKGSKNYFQSKNKNRFFLITETRIESNWNL